MITKWRLFNFKSVRTQTELTFKPLTIFAGANSSGKSTVLQSMLLVSQTVSSMVPSRSVVLNGHLTKLGQFDDLIQQGSESQQIALGWECAPIREPEQFLDPVRTQSRLLADPTERLTSISIDFAFDALGAGGPADLAQLQPLFYGLNLECITRNEEGNDTVSTLAVNRRAESAFLSLRNQLSVEFGGSGNLFIPRGVGYRVEMDAATEGKLRSLEVPFEIQGCQLRHFLPERFIATVHEDEVRANLIIRALKGQGPPRRHAARLRDEGDIPIPQEVIALLKARFQEKPHPILTGPPLRPRPGGQAAEVMLRDCVQRMRHMPRIELERIESAIKELEREICAIVSGKGSHTAGWMTVGLPASIRNATEYTTQWFANGIQYLGPLRDEPKPLYPLATNVDPLDIGLCGEHTAAVLHLHADLPVEYLPADNFKQPAISLQRSRRSLQFAVLDWLKYMGVATHIDTIDKGKLGHELKVRLSETDKSHDLTHVGVGVSQVLPIVVSCLLAGPDTTLIFEQPELHLHPKVQTLLGDFFLAMATLGKQCILETHSEYLINRLRFRTASAPKDSLSSVVQLYFVEKQEGVSRFREVTINQYGAILDWPDGFFDQSQSEAEEILRAATLKKRSEKEDPGNGKRNS